MKKYVSPIIEIEEVEVEDIIMSETITPGENEGPGMPLYSVNGTTQTEVPAPLSQYFNEQ